MSKAVLSSTHITHGSASLSEFIQKVITLPHILGYKYI